MLDTGAMNLITYICMNDDVIIMYWKWMRITSIYPTLTLHWYHYSWPRVVWSKPPPSPCKPGSPPAPAGCRPRAPGPIRDELGGHVTSCQPITAHLVEVLAVHHGHHQHEEACHDQGVEHDWAPGSVRHSALVTLLWGSPCRYAVLYNVMCEGAAGGLNVLART